MTHEPEWARLIGGAGTGKTTELKRVMEAALPRLGGDPMRLGFASFTRAARAEAVARVSAAWNVAPAALEGEGWFRTIHSTAKRCLKVSSSQLVADKAGDLEWLSQAFGVKLSTTVDDDSGHQRYIGDPDVAAALNCWGLARSCLVPLEGVIRGLRTLDDTVPHYDRVVRLIRHYETAKRTDNRVDFTDLLLRFTGLRLDPEEGVYSVTPEGDLPPVSAWLFDEQQDASPLLDAACKRLVSAPTVRWGYLVGDPFQAIYGFAGSTADCFLGWPVKKERTMPKSYRCPKPILELGERCLRRMARGYFDRQIAPADHDGEVKEVCGVDDAVAAVDPSDDWLFIARTNYHAATMIAALNAANKPCRWVKSPEGASAKGEGLAALFSLENNEHVTGQQWARALPLLPLTDKAGRKLLTRGTKTTWGERYAEQYDVMFANDLVPLGGATEALVEDIRSGRWVAHVDDGQRWRNRAVKHGVKLATEPRVRVGTIHSVKGAEADHVAFLTSTTKRITDRSSDSPAVADEEHRVAYVAVTRARRTLTVINESRGGRKVNSMEVL